MFLGVVGGGEVGNGCMWMGGGYGKKGVEGGRWRGGGGMCFGVGGGVKSVDELAFTWGQKKNSMWKWVACVGGEASVAVWVLRGRPHFRLAKGTLTPSNIPPPQKQ